MNYKKTFAVLCSIALAMSSTPLLSGATPKTEAGNKYMSAWYLGGSIVAIAATIGALLYYKRSKQMHTHSTLAISDSQKENISGNALPQPSVGAHASEQTAQSSAVPQRRPSWTVTYPNCCTETQKSDGNYTFKTCDGMQTFDFFCGRNAKGEWCESTRIVNAEYDENGVQGHPHLQGPNIGWPERMPSLSLLANNHSRGLGHLRRS